MGVFRCCSFNCYVIGDDMSKVIKFGKWFYDFSRRGKIETAREAWNAAIEASAELVYEMKFMANEHVAKLIRGLKDE